jgi:hypothetical protein
MRLTHNWTVRYIYNLTGRAHNGTVRSTKTEEESCE